MKHGRRWALGKRRWLPLEVRDAVGRLDMNALLEVNGLVDAKRALKLLRERN